MCVRYPIGKDVPCFSTTGSQEHPLCVRVCVCVGGGGGGGGYHLEGSLAYRVWYPIGKDVPCFSTTGYRYSHVYKCLLHVYT